MVARHYDSDELINVLKQITKLPALIETRSGQRFVVYNEEDSPAQLAKKLLKDLGEL